MDFDMRGMNLEDRKELLKWFFLNQPLLDNRKCKVGFIERTVCFGQKTKRGTQELEVSSYFSYN